MDDMTKKNNNESMTKKDRIKVWDKIMAPRFKYYPSTAELYVYGDSPDQEQYRIKLVYINDAHDVIGEAIRMMEVGWIDTLMVRHAIIRICSILKIKTKSNKKNKMTDYQKRHFLSAI